MEKGSVFPPGTTEEVVIHLLFKLLVQTEICSEIDVVIHAVRSIWVLAHCLVPFGKCVCQRCIIKRMHFVDALALVIQALRRRPLKILKRRQILRRRQIRHRHQKLILALNQIPHPVE